MEREIRVPASAAGQNLAEWLRANGYAVPAPCGGNGRCGGCRVRTADGGELLACRTVCPDGGLALLLPEETPVPAVRDARPGETYGLALDIGTTTLEAAVVCLETGETVAAASRLNGQAAFGADVMTRIEKAETDLAALRDAVRRDARLLAEELLPRGACRYEKVTVAANTTMLHLFAGVSPSGMGRAPFTPAFLEARHLAGEACGLPADDVLLLPSCSAFIGSDAVGGAAVAMGDETRPVLLLDVGTNGEMLLRAGGRYFAASAAAGPALEGAGISCGMGGVPGAVCRVTAEGDGLAVRTVGDAPARGICGSGLLDLCAVLLGRGILDESGTLEGGAFDVAPGVTLTQRDVRALQTAKAALRAGFAVLLVRAGVREADLARVYLAGGLGCRLDPVSAARIGLLPPSLLPVVRPAGNTALEAAKRALTDPGFPARMQAIADATTDVPLGTDPLFAERFIDEMAFPVWE